MSRHVTNNEYLLFKSDEAYDCKTRYSTDILSHRRIPHLCVFSVLRSASSEFRDRTLSNLYAFMLWHPQPITQRNLDAAWPTEEPFPLAKNFSQSALSITPKQLRLYRSDFSWHVYVIGDSSTSHMIVGKARAPGDVITTPLKEFRQQLHHIQMPRIVARRPPNCIASGHFSASVHLIRDLAIHHHRTLLRQQSSRPNSNARTIHSVPNTSCGIRTQCPTRNPPPNPPGTTGSDLRTRPKCVMMRSDAHAKKRQFDVLAHLRPGTNDQILGLNDDCARAHVASPVLRAGPVHLTTQLSFRPTLSECTHDDRHLHTTEPRTPPVTSHISAIALPHHGTIVPPFLRSVEFALRKT